MQSDGACVLSVEGGGHYGQDAVDSLWKVSTLTKKSPVCTRFLYNLEAVFVIAMQDTRSHEREDRHDISEDGLRR